MIRPCEGNCFYHPCTKLHWEVPYFGVMKVTVLPPTDLLYPVLPTITLVASTSVPVLN